MRRLFHSTSNQVINKIEGHFSYQNTKLYAAVFALPPENSNFLDVKMMQSLLDLVDRTSAEAEFDIAIRRTLQNWTVMRKQSQQQPNSFLNIVKN